MGGIDELSHNELKQRVLELESKLDKLHNAQKQRSYDDLISDKLNFGIFILKTEDQSEGKSLRFVYANEASEKISGLKRKDFIDKTVNESFPDFCENGIAELLDNSIKTNTVFESKEIYYNNENTGPKTLSVKAFPLGDNHFALTFENISKRKSIQKALIESEERFRSILFNANSIIYLKDTAGRYLLVNRMFEELFQHKNPDVIGKSDFDIFPEKYAEEIAKNDAEVIKNKKTISIEEVLPVKDKLYTFLASKFPIYDNEKNIYASCCIATDITDRKNAEEELNKIFSLSADLICINTLDGHFLKVNPAFEKVLGYTEEEIYKKPLFEFLHPDDLKRTVDTVKEKLEGKENIIMLENRYRCKDGVYKWFSWISQAIPEKNIAFSIARDITNQKFYEKEIIIAKERAEESDKLKSAFLANMSHEIRTPMNGILGFSKMLESENLQVEKRNQYIGFIHASAEQLLTIINDIIDISRIESGQLKFNISNTDLNRLMDVLYTQFETERINRNKHNIKLQCIKGIAKGGSVILTDETRIRQVLSNLISNALKFSDNGTIKFGYQMKDDSNLLFFVKDSGIGISGSKQSIIFERFRQEDESFTRKYGGTGLGLAISKSIIEQMGGKIWVDSEKNKGAAFYISLPFEQSPFIRKITDEADSEMEYCWNNKTILIVEDDYMGSEYLKEIMEPTGVMIMLAENGIDAVNICKNKPEIGLILMDLRLPKMDGYAATLEIRKSRPEVPIIVQTANALPEDKERAMNAGSNEFITKPINRLALLNIIDKYLAEEVVG